jgi:hypothetical protein
VSVLFDDSAPPARAMVLALRGGGLTVVSDMHRYRQRYYDAVHFVLLHSTAHEGWREGIELRARGGTIVGWWLDHPVETAWKCRACGQDHDEQTYLCGGVVVAGGAVSAGVQPPYGAPVGGGGAAVAARAGGSKARGAVTVMQYYAYRLMFRGATSAGAYLHRARRLFQEWLE